MEYCGKTWCGGVLDSNFANNQRTCLPNMRSFLVAGFSELLNPLEFLFPGLNPQFTQLELRPIETSKAAQG